MRLTRRSLTAALSAMLLLVGLAPSAFAASEDTLLGKLNAERTSRGLATLASHWDLVDDAEAHSNRMMARDELHHNPNLGNVTTGWTALGENVGVGPSVDSIHNAFMNSPAHRGNILGDFTHVGIGAVRESDNKLWVTVVFMKAAGATTTTAPPSSTTSSTTIGPVVTTTTNVATTTEAPSPPATTRPPSIEQPGAPSKTGTEAVAAGLDLVKHRPVLLQHQPRPD